MRQYPGSIPIAKVARQKISEFKQHAVIINNYWFHTFTPLDPEPYMARHMLKPVFEFDEKPISCKCCQPLKSQNVNQGKIEMLKYHYCAHCGMFTAKEKDKCLYCGADLNGIRRHFYSGQALSSLRSLLNGGPLQKLKRKTEGDTFA